MAAFMQTLGGIGLFLFGMSVMTSGLQKLAGDRLRSWLARSTTTPLSGAATGAAATALIQSSSATTVAAIGFVGAGLMTFTASLGLIFGANIGTTFTGWMVALLGFKLQLSEAALPLLFIAALCYLFKRKRFVRGFGKALAGFSLIFIGIGYLQLGLGGYGDLIDLSEWSAESLGGRVGLVLVGAVLTLLTQSSSATVAAALTALNASVLDLPQAAAVIIGADIGTTGTAALATIGGTTAARRTGFAHVIYNLMTGIVAFFMLPVYLAAVAAAWPGAATDSAEVVAVGFHSAFNVLGVILVLPLTKPFGRLIERLFPERSSPLASLFDKHLLDDPSAATGGLDTGSLQVAVAALRRVVPALDPELRADTQALEEVQPAIECGREFALKVGARGANGEEQSQRVFDCIHLLDHVERLTERAHDLPSAHAVCDDPELRAQATRSAFLAGQLANRLEKEGEPSAEAEQLLTMASEMEREKPRFRQELIRSSAIEPTSGADLDALLDAHRWLRRMVYHLARIAHYGNELRTSRF